MKPSRYLGKIRQRAKRWKMPGNRKESTVADSFGLKALRERIKRNITAEDRAREDINRIGRKESVDSVEIIHC